MKTDFTITDADIGRVLPITDGYLVNLTRTASTPPGFEIIQWDEGRQRFKAGRFVLRGTGDFRDLCCIDTQSGVSMQHGRSDAAWTNANIGYRGGLEVVCVPRGSQWSLTISDIPNQRSAPATSGWAPTGAFGDGSGFKHPPLRPTV